MQIVTKTQQAVHAPAYIPILLDTLRLDKILSFDLYIYINREMVLYRSQSLPFTEATRSKLLENRVDKLYISREAKGQYQRYIENNLPDILSDPKLPQSKKATILYETSKTLVREVIAKPTSSDNIRRSQDLVLNTIDYVLRGRDAFLSLMKLTSYDYYTYTHSVNVCTFSVSLARQIGITDKASLSELGAGALLHDVGKSKVSERIINKRTKLNRAEFEIMKRHPAWGVEILQETNILASESYYPVIQHHERLDGSGYPHGMGVKDIHLYGRIVAICDSFDAMTTQRVYQEALGSFPTLKIMHGCKDQYDLDLLHEFTVMIGPDSDKNDY